MTFLTQIHPFVLLLLASLFTYLLTALGSAVVFCFKPIHKRPLDIMLSISAGLMIAASIWSLTIPAVNLAEELWHNSWLLPSIGFLTGGLFIILSSIIIDKALPNATKKKRSILIIGVMPLHNIPEGLAVGVSFSGFAIGMNGCSLASALMIALGIGIQNIPDGIAISLPLYRDGMSKGKAFLYGQSSGIMEIIAAIIGYFVTISIRSVLPFFFTFAAGAMITVVVSELIPDISPENRKLGVIGFIIGFTVMMILDLAITI